MDTYFIAFFLDGCEGLLFYTTMFGTNADSVLRKLYTRFGANAERLRIVRVLEVPYTDDGRVREADKIYVRPYEHSHANRTVQLR